MRLVFVCLLEAAALTKSVLLIISLIGQKIVLTFAGDGQMGETGKLMEMFFFFAVGDSKHSDIASLLELELQKTSLLYQGHCLSTYQY